VVLEEVGVRVVVPCLIGCVEPFVGEVEGMCAVAVDEDFCWFAVYDVGFHWLIVEVSVNCTLMELWEVLHVDLCMKYMLI